MVELEEFEMTLDKDLAWRRKELTNLFLLYNDENKNIIIKSSILFIYSHWEGYIKNSCKLYLEFVSNQSIPLCDLTENFSAISLKGRMKESFNSCESLTLVNELLLMKLINEDSNKVFKVSDKFKKNEKDKSIVNTKDNLNFKVLSSLFEIVGIGKRDCIATKEVYIDDKLLNNRNKISHGVKVDSAYNEFDLDIDNVKEIRNTAFSIMTSISDDLKYYAEKEFFLLKNSELCSAYNVKSNSKLEKDFNQFK